MGNLFISGSCALELMGLILPRNPDDLDIVIYHPIEMQVKHLNRLYKTTTNLDYNQISIILYKREDSEIINIFVDNTSLAPEKLLYYQNFPINNIQSIIEAKAGYDRDKDIKDLLDFKFLNFNK